MTRMSPAQYVAEMRNAPGGGVAAPHATEGAPMPTTVKEDMMHKSTPAPARPWLEPAHEHYLTEQDLADLDATYTRWSSSDRPALVGVDLVAYVRDQATERCHVRRIVGPGDVPLPAGLHTVDRVSVWERTSTFAARREIDAEAVTVEAMSAVLEVSQELPDNRVSILGRIEEGYAATPAELAEFADRLAAQARRWAEIEGVEL